MADKRFGIVRRHVGSAAQAEKLMAGHPNDIPAAE